MNNETEKQNAGDSRNSIPTPCYVQRFTIELTRITENDRYGMLEIEAEGFENWNFVDVGSHVGMQCEHDGENKAAMKFATEVSRLVVRGYLDKVRPLLHNAKISHED